MSKTLHLKEMKPLKKMKQNTKPVHRIKQPKNPDYYVITGDSKYILLSDRELDSILIDRTTLPKLIKILQGEVEV
jgi:hypothetical protein